ncbi:MAG: putative rRNA methylase [Firmicutes bacterium]|nr:putative rRNA methylase [Bacillota bacterium]
MKTKVISAVQMAHAFLTAKLSEARYILDATAGNGHDTLFLAKHTPPDATIWFFDIQEQSLLNTISALNEAGLAYKCRPIHDCHTKIRNYVNNPLDAVMFNLGYLPGGSHEVTTKTDTTLTAIQETLRLLAHGGLLSVVAYPGHPEGRLENEAVRGYLSQLLQKEFTVGSWEMVNQQNTPPILYIVEKR